MTAAMSGAVRWWGTPGALVVMTGVLMLGDEDLSSTKQRPPQMTKDAMPVLAAEQTELPEHVMVRDASGKRQPFAFAAAASQALILVFPDHFAGQRIDLSLWRRIGGEREQQPWLSLRPLVRADATLPMAGIVPGSYDIEFGLPDQSRFLVVDQKAPGQVNFTAATPIR